MEANNTVTNGFEETAQHNTEERSVKFIDNNNEGENAGESHVTQAEVNHIHQLEEEPIAPKRNVFTENDVTPTDQTDGTTFSSSALPETSENFIKIEEKNVIERLSRVIDSELSIESLRVEIEDKTEEIDDNEPQLESDETKHEEHKQEPEEPVTHTYEPESEEDINSFQVSHEKEESLEDNTPEKSFAITTHENRHEENHFQDNGLTIEESNHINEEKSDEIFESQNHREESSPVVEDKVIKQNGRKVIYSSEEDLEEEADQMGDSIAFKSTLKKWSTGKPGQTDGTDAQPVSNKDKFKTLRQIRKGNTRSLMERFQSPAKS